MKSLSLSECNINSKITVNCQHWNVWKDIKDDIQLSMKMSKMTSIKMSKMMSIKMSKMMSMKMSKMMSMTSL